MTEANTVPDAQSIGRRRDFADFYRTRYGEALRVAMYVGAAREQAHDAVQDAMIEVFQRWEKVAQPWPWMRKAVVTESSRPRSETCTG